MNAMSNRDRMVRGAAWFLAGFMLMSGNVRAQKVSGESILQEIERQLAGLNDFSVNLDIVADMERLDVPPMHATLYFKRPDKLHLQSDGFAILPREASMLIAGKLADRFAATNDGMTEIGGKKYYLVGLTPKNPKAARAKLTLLVDPERWTAERLESSLPGGREVTATFDQTRIDGIWLTAKVTVKLETAEQDTTVGAPQGIDESQMRRQVPRNGTMTITYSDYRVNTGLPDSIFANEALK